MPLASHKNITIKINNHIATLVVNIPNLGSIFVKGETTLCGADEIKDRTVR
jgi:hypothetical protein